MADPGGAGLKPFDIWSPEEGTGAPARDLRIFGTCTDQRLRATVATDSTPKRTGISAFIPPGTGAPHGKAPRRVTDQRKGFCQAAP